MGAQSPLMAADIMSSELLMVQEHWSLQSLIGFFVRHRITGAPVVREQTREAVGVVSLTDLLTFDAKPNHSLGENPMAQYYYSAMEGASIDDLGIQEGNPHLSHLVGEIMTPTIVSAPASMPVTELATILCDKGIHRIFITEGKNLCGVVSTLDILKHLDKVCLQVYPARAAAEGCGCSH